MPTTLRFRATWLIDSFDSTPLSRFRPSGVISKAHARTMATGKPRASSNKITCMTQVGAAMLSSTRSATWASNQAITT